MRKNLIRKWTVIVLSGMFVVALSGCGTSAKATDITADDSKGIEIETEVNTDDVSDETMNTEVIGEDTEEASKVNDTDDIPTIDLGYLVIYDWVFESEVEIDRESFHVLNTPETYTLNQDTNVYGTNGELAGYIKAGSEVTFNNRNDDWIRFTPDVEGVRRHFKQSSDCAVAAD